MTWTTAALVMGGSSLASGLLGSSAAKKAAATQADAIRYAADVQKAMYEQSRKDLGPYRETGYGALQDIEERMPYLTQQFGSVEALAPYLDPSMAFRMKYGTQATERLANVGQGTLSGNTMRRLSEFGQELASSEYQNAFNRAQTERGNIYSTLANLAGMGQNAINTGVQAGQATASNLGQLAVGGGQAIASGIMGQANALGGALGGIGNAAQLYALGSSGFFNRPGTTTPVTPGTGVVVNPIF